MKAALPELVLHLPSLDALRAEVPNLLKRRAFVAGAGGVELRSACTLVLVHPEGSSRLSLAAEVVWVEESGPGRGVGVELERIEAEALRAFVDGATEPGLSELEVLEPPEHGESDDDDLSGLEVLEPPLDAAADEDLSGLEVLEPPSDEEPADDSRDEGASPSRLHPKSVLERVRAFTIRERDACARSGTLSERVALERCYGSAVWEPLLSNPQITPPEVARIARNGTIPKPLVAMIVANGGWLALGEVQRALLSNPRVTGPHVERILRALSPADLKRVPQQTAYRAVVRQAAQKLLKG
jgi:hypothetical protein